MSRVQKHPTDKGKYQSTFDTYGHGKGNGKSRNSVYKHFKKLARNTASEEVSTQNTTLNPDDGKVSTQNTTLNPDDGKVSTQNTTLNPDDEKVSTQNTTLNLDDEEENPFSKVVWDETQTSKTPIKPRTIPKPIADMATGKASEVTTEATGQVIRFGFMTLDRMVTHWGRGVTGNTSYSIDRSRHDYDALEASSLSLLAHYGITVNASPLLVWSATVGNAYVPVIYDIQKNAHPNRKKGIISRILSRFKRRKAKKVQTPTPNETEALNVLNA